MTRLNFGRCPEDCEQSDCPPAALSDAPPPLVSDFSDACRPTWVTPFMARRRDMRGATSDCEVVQPVSSMAGPWWVPRSWLPPPPSTDTPGATVAAIVVIQAFDGMVRLTS